MLAQARANYPSPVHLLVQAICAPSCSSSYRFTCTNGSSACTFLHYLEVAASESTSLPAQGPQPNPSWDTSGEGMLHGLEDEFTKCSGESGLSRKAMWKSKYLFPEHIYGQRHIGSVKKQHSHFFQILEDGSWMNMLNYHPKWQTTVHPHFRNFSTLITVFL